MPSPTTSQNVRQPDDLVDAGSRTLRRGLQLLDVILQKRREGVRVAELCRACGLQRATVYRLLSTLIESGYVSQRDRWRYVPGPRTKVFLQPPPADDLAARLQPVLARVSAACGEPSFAVLAEGRMSHCIARQLGTQPIQVLVVEIGRRQPLGVGAAGLALLAAMSPTESAAIVAANAQVLPRYGGMTPERMDILVTATRERGWSVVGNHVIEGTLGVGVPVPAIEGPPVAAISVAAPQDRMPRQRQQLIARRMREALETLLPAGL
ncbi:IclR family transcriptional regulator [Variovorax ginsengisoli]|uniref:DNA-binding IclR family transcriptional regulator n=1 Tax=Variovorax ginsengisoli TaxID=363844 RepID=A0ABT9S991_9BURK|nr:helix-turn-helix domain-containing protein [Variovorax ginsengisoli]MDP9900930.1 DNA-binding IclR family transcriptional regulator [Variovorax ginsengisoli]